MFYYLGFASLIHSTVFSKSFKFLLEPNTSLFIGPLMFIHSIERSKTHEHDQCLLDCVMAAYSE